MSSSIRLRTKITNGITSVRAIIRHPMETGFRHDTENNKIIPAHYINQVIVKHNDTIILSCDWSRAVSKNPYLAFKFKGANPGDKLELSWTDIENKSDSIQTIIK